MPAGDEGLVVVVVGTGTLEVVVTGTVVVGFLGVVTVLVAVVWTGDVVDAGGDVEVGTGEVVVETNGAITANILK